VSVWRHVFLVAAVVTISCAPAPYRPEVALTNNFFQSTDGLLRGRIPSGWLSLSETELPPHLAGCLFREDYSAVLTFEGIEVDSSTKVAIEREGLLLLANISLSLKLSEESSVVVVKQPEAFTLEGKHFARYAYDVKGEQVNVVLFRVKNRYVESTATLRAQTLENPAADPPSSYENVVNTQQAVILSVESD
jgi:hypothetical protein